MPGGLGDANSSMVILERWLVTCNGFIPWKGSNFLLPAHGVLAMRVVADGFCASRHPRVRVTVFVNDYQDALSTLTAAGERDERVAQAPPDVLVSPVTVIRFRITDPASPRDVGLSADTRGLGILVKQITLVQNR